MKLLHVVHSCNPAAGGVAEAVMRLASAAKDLGDEAEIASCDLPEASFLEALPKTIRGFGPTSGGNYHHCPNLRSWILQNAERFDALIAHGLWQYPGVAVRKAALKAGKPYFIYPHGMLDPWFRRTYPLKHVKKQFFWWFRQGRILRDAKGVCFTTEEERRLARKTFRPYHCKEVVTGLGVDEPPLDDESQTKIFFESFPELSGLRLLLFLGRIHRKKGIDLLLRAFSKKAGSNDHLVLAGPVEDTVYSKELKQMSEPFCERVTWAGMLSGDLKWGALRAADALALPSHQENFGMVVAEALSVGTPVLITDKVNLWREVEDTRAGHVSTDDLSGINALLREWRSPAFSELSSNAKACYEKHFRISTAAGNLSELAKNM